MSAAAAAPYEMPKRKRTMIFLDIMIAIIGITFLVTAMNIALPTMKEVLGVNDTLGQWLISGYSLAMGMAMPLTAFLIHRIKTKRLFIVGIVIYLIGLVITLIGNVFFIVLLGRIFQGVGAAILMSMAQVIILTIYPPNERGKAMGNYGLAMGIAPIIASLVCGMMVQYISWRSIFILAAILMVVSLTVAFVVFDNVLDTIPQKFDTLSFIITLLTFGGITLGLGNLFSYGFFSISTWPVLAVGIVAAIILVIRQFRMETPFLDLKTFKSTQFAVGVIGVCMLYLISLGKGVIIQQYYQTVLGWAPTIASILVIPGSIINAVVSPFGGRLYDKIGIRRIFIISSLILFVGCMGMVFAGSNGMVSTVVATIFYSSQSIGLGLLLMPLQTWATAGAGEGKVVDGTAVLSSMRTLANSNGVVIATGIMTVFAGRMAAKGGDVVQQYARGVSSTFFYMALLSIGLLILAIIFGKKKQAAKPAAAAETISDEATEPELEEEAEKEIEEFKEEMTEKAEEAKEAAGGAAQEASDKVEEAAGKAEEAVEEAAGKVEEAADKAEEAAKDAADKE